MLSPDSQLIAIERCMKIRDNTKVEGRDEQRNTRGVLNQ